MHFFNEVSLQINNEIIIEAVLKMITHNVMEIKSLIIIILIGNYTIKTYYIYLIISAR